MTTSPRKSPRKRPNKDTAAVPRVRKERRCLRCPGLNRLQKTCPEHSAMAARLRKAEEKREKAEVLKPSQPLNTSVDVDNQSTTEGMRPTNNVQDSDGLGTKPCPAVEADEGLEPHQPSPCSPSQTEQHCVSGEGSQTSIEPNNGASVTPPTNTAPTEADASTSKEMNAILAPITILSNSASSTDVTDNPFIADPADSRHTLLTMNGQVTTTSLRDDIDTASSLGSSPPVSPSRSLTPSLSASTSRINKRLRVRPTVKNRVYGLVEGVQRGASEWKIARLHNLKPQLPTIGEIHKRFDEKLAAILTRCEELASETGCYLFVSASVPTRGSELVHYASKRLRKEAPDALDRIYQLHFETIQALVNARRKDVLQAEMEVARARAAQHAAEASEANLRADLESVTRSNEENKVLIEGLRAILGPNALTLLAGANLPKP